MTTDTHPSLGDGLVDPEGILLIQMGITAAGVAVNAVAIYLRIRDLLTPDPPPRPIRVARDNMRTNLGIIRDAQVRLQAELGLLQDLIREAKISEETPFVLGRRPWYLRQDQFQRYRAIQRAMLDLTKTMGEAMGEIERIEAIIAPPPDTYAPLAETYDALNHIMKDREVTMGEALRGVTHIVAEMEKLTADALHHL